LKGFEVAHRFSSYARRRQAQGRKPLCRRLAWAFLPCLLLLATRPAAADNCTIRYEQVLPVTMANMRPEIEAVVNNRKVRFLLDSGAFYSVITPGTAAALGLPVGPGPRGLTMRAAGGAVKPGLVTIETLQVAGGTFHQATFLAGGSEVGDGDAGVLGQNFLRSDVEYDLANGVVRLAIPQDCITDPVYWAAGTGHSTVDLVPFDRNFRAITTYVEVNGHLLKAQFDTGAGISLLTLAAARRLGFDPAAHGVAQAGVSHGFGRNTFRTWIMPIDSFRLGAEELKHTQLQVGDTTFGDIDMLIGADFFLSHHIYVSTTHRRIYFTYNGGPIFDPGASTGRAPVVLRQAAAGPPTPGPSPSLFSTEPTNAEGYARRGEALLDRQDYAGAIADLTKAHQLAPGEATYLYRRAQAYARSHKPFLAMADLDAALELAPDNVEARLGRASMRISGADPAGAREDLDAVDRRLVPQADERLTLGALYVAVRAYDPAARQFDLWIRAHPDDARFAAAQNGRCWMGAMSGAGLDQTLAACNEAVRLEPKNASFLDSRGLVRLRRGDTDKALDDYNAALALDPKIAWSLYGRALAEQRKGMARAAKADFAAATALSPKIAEEARSHGIVS
jgi:tetratricopeptide (TPR) repeat protein/predicted aspartyl protease